MSRPPSLKRLSADDLKDLTDDQKAFAGKLFQALNPFLQDVSTALNKRLTVSENLAAVVKEVQFQVPATWKAIAVACGELPSKPLGALVIKCEDWTARDLAPAVAPTLAWEPSAIGTTQAIRITGQSGLTTGRVYKLRLLILV